MADKTEKTAPIEAKSHLFKPGQSGNPAGRPKGSRNALGEQFIAALYEDFIKNGEEVIEAVRREKPDQYLKVIASIVPKHVELTGKDAAPLFPEVTDEQRAQALLVFLAKTKQPEEKKDEESLH